jgi:hypothetical protein
MPKCPILNTKMMDLCQIDLLLIQIGGIQIFKPAVKSYIAIDSGILRSVTN